MLAQLINQAGWVPNERPAAKAARLAHPGSGRRHEWVVLVPGPALNRWVAGRHGDDAYDRTVAAGVPIHTSKPPQPARFLPTGKQHAEPDRRGPPHRRLAVAASQERARP